MVTCYLGIDNGVSGSIALIDKDEVRMVQMPVKKEQSYTKAKAQITRVDYPQLTKLFDDWWAEWHSKRRLVLIERPFVNPKGFKATVSALRCLEATLIAVEAWGLPYQYIDSRQWQKVMLPKGVKGTPELKAASRDIGIRLFPHLRSVIERHKDADSLLIAEWARREGL